jgi:hypothetical protein
VFLVAHPAVAACLLACLSSGLPAPPPPPPQVGLRGINGLYLFEVERADGGKAKVVDQDTALEKGDILWFAGGVVFWGVEAGFAV